MKYICGDKGKYRSQDLFKSIGWCLPKEFIAFADRGYVKIYTVKL